jgi:hypothetical protein
VVDPGESSQALPVVTVAGAGLYSREDRARRHDRERTDRERKNAP